MFELHIINPATYKPHNLRLFRNVTNISTTKAYNNIGSFGFSVKADLVEFEEAINTPDGQGQVMVYAEGKPYIHGIITSYKPSDSGFVEVECTEILQILRDDVLEGDFKLSNWIADYVPRSSPDAEANLDDKKLYWGEKGNSFFTTDFTTSSTQNAVYTIAQEEDKGVSYNLKDTLYFCRFYPRKFIGQYQPEMTTFIEGIGMQQNYFFLGSHTYNVRTDSETNPNSLESGIYTSLRFTDLVNGEYFNWVMELKSKINGVETVLASMPILLINTPEGKIYPEDLLFRSESKTRYAYKENAASIEVSVKAEFKYMGYTFTYEINPASVAKPSNLSSFNCQGYFKLCYGAYVNSYKVERVVKQTYGHWLADVSESVRFLAGDTSGILDGYTWNLKASNAEKWSVVKTILEFMGSASLSYAGIVLGKPTYLVFDYESIPTKFKFADGDEIFNISYEKDFSSAFNVLTANASRERVLGGTTVNEVFSVTIAPNPARPNRLGRLIKRTMKPSSIEDLATLTQWALAVYEENSYPEEPIDFETYASSFWLDCKLGQYVTIHGLLQGKTITEQVNKISIDSSTGVASIELAKRITLKSALIEARLAGQ